MLYREDMDQVVMGGCSSPDCTDPHVKNMFIHGKCHTGAGNEVEYNEGVLHIRCLECKKPIADFPVQPRPQARTNSPLRSVEVP